MLMPMSNGLVMGGGAKAEFVDHFMNTASEDYLDFRGLTFAAGDLLVGLLTSHNASSVVTQAIPGFTNLISGVGNNTSLGVYWKIADGTEDTVNIGENTRTSSAVMSFSGAAVGVAAHVDVSGDPPSIANAAGDIVVVFGAEDESNPASSTAPAGYTQLINGEVTNNDNNIQLAYKPDAPANEDPGVWTGWPTASRYGVVTFSVTGA